MRKVWLNIRADILRAWPAHLGAGSRRAVLANLSRGYSRVTGARPSGFSAVEILLAATVFGLLVIALSGAIIYGRAGTAASGDRAQAIALAEEGLEAVRNIRDAAYTNLSNGNTGLAVSGGQWIFSGTSDATGIFTRQVNIAQVDTVRKTVTSTVSWATNGAAHSAAAVMRIANWRTSLPPVMMVYSKTTTTPFYRIWNGSSWSAEGSANAVVGNINYLVVKSARTRNEAILGVQTTTGAIYVQVYNGNTSTWGAATQVGTGPTTTRSLDIAYEKNGDRAVIVYSPSSGSADFAYRTWNGTTLSSASTITTPPTTGAVNWIELDQSPVSSSNDIAMIMLDANSDVYGMLWNGSSWGTMGAAAAWDTTATTSPAKKGIDVEYEQMSGEALFMWGDSVATDQYYRTWNGTTLSGATLLDIAAEGGVAEWIQLASRPSSNEIMLGVQDAGADLNTRVWSGSAWGAAHAEHSAATENIASRNFDILWETHTANPGKAWLMWGNGTTVSVKAWASAAWGSASALASSDDTSFVRLRADPARGTVFGALYEDTSSATDDIWETRLTGGGSSWSAKNSIWAGPTTASPAHFKIDIATP